MPELSKLHFYSIGIVAINKKISSKIIEVTCSETTPMLSGEITDNKSKVKAEATDSDGGAYQVEMESTVTVKATWLPINSSNRLTAPDVRRGETVIVYRFADTDNFFWSTLKDDAHLRRLETVIYAFSASQKEGAPVDAENYYFVEVSTHKKIIHISTSKANGEFCSYDIQINAGDGFIMIQDDIGNYFSFDSKAHQIEMKNVDGSLIEVNKVNINLECSDTITQKAKNIIQTATSHKLTAATSQVTAETTQTGNFSMAGAGGGTGEMTVNATMKVTQNIESQADVIASGISLVNHSHPDAQGGDVGKPM